MGIEYTSYRQFKKMVVSEKEGGLSHISASDTRVLQGQQVIIASIRGQLSGVFVDLTTS